VVLYLLFSASHKMVGSVWLPSLVAIMEMKLFLVLGDLL
jgi:hypothetical protein